MAGDHFEPDWADKTAKWTFLWTVAGVIAFVIAVYVWIF